METSWPAWVRTNFRESLLSFAQVQPKPLLEVVYAKVLVLIASDIGAHQHVLADSITGAGTQSHD